MDLSFVIMLAAAFLAGGINAVAGGGTLFTFTALGLKLPLLHANATNSALLAPASLISAIAFARELRQHWRKFCILAIPSIAGSYAGAVVLANTSDEIFKRVVPFLILFAVLLFAFKDQFSAFVQKKLGRNPKIATSQADQISLFGWLGGIIFQFVVAFYGGYFGAGIGILMITSFHLMGLRDLHVMNALKNPLAFLMNGMAALRLALDAGNLINWSYALPMSLCAITGGYLAAHASRKIPQKFLRVFVIGYGLVIAVFLFGRYWLGWFSG